MAARLQINTDFTPLLGVGIAKQACAGFTDPNGNDWIVLNDSQFPVNALEIDNANTGSPVILTVNGIKSDPNGGITLKAAGTGTVTLGAAGQTVTVPSGVTFSVVNLTITGTLTLTGATVAGSPTWSNAQTLPGLTMVGTLTMGANTLDLTSATVNGQPTWSSGQTFPGVTLSSGNLTFSTTGQRIQGDFSNATEANRVLVQTSTTNGVTTLGALPNGSGTQAAFRAYNSNDPANAAWIQLTVSSSAAQIATNKNGTGTVQPFSIAVGGTPYLTIPTTGGVQVNSGNIGIGGAPLARVGVFITGLIPNSSSTPFGIACQPILDGTTTDVGIDSTITIQTSVAATTVYGMRVTSPVLNSGASITTLKGLSIGSGAAFSTVATNTTGIEVGAVTGATGNAIGVDISAPSGATTNIGLRNAGTTQLTGNVGVGIAPDARFAIYGAQSFSASSGVAAMIRTGNTLTASATSDNLKGLDVANAFALGGQTGVTSFGIHIEPTWVAGATNYGLRIESVTGGATTNTAIFLATPSGASTNRLIDSTVGFTVDSSGNVNVPSGAVYKVNGATLLSTVTNTLAGDVNLNNTGAFFDGPSCAQGTSGTWLAYGTVTLVDSTNAALFICKLWDGTTVMASGVVTATGAGNNCQMALSGIITNPAANIRISVNDGSSNNGKIKFNASSGPSHDATLTVVRIA